MIRRDWFKAKVEAVAQGLGVVLGLRKKGDILGSAAAMEAVVQEAFGMSGVMALGLPLEQFVFLAFRGEKPSPELLSKVGELFLEWASLLEAQGRSAEAASARARSQGLLTP